MTNCRHAESLWGRCAECGMTWEQQIKRQQARADTLRDALEAALHDLRWSGDHIAVARIETTLRDAA